MPVTKECEKAKKEFDMAKYRVKLAIMGVMSGGKDVFERLRKRREELNRAAERLGEACEWETSQHDSGTDETGKPKKLEIKFHPRLSEDEKKKIKGILMDPPKGKIPKKHKICLKEINLKGKHGPTRNVYGRVVIASGDYNRETGVINDYYPPEVSTVKHEIGHHVYYKKISKRMRERWKKFWATHKKKMPTNYATWHESEGFAEVYEYLMNGKKLDPEVEKEMKDILGTIK